MRVKEHSFRIYAEVRDPEPISINKAYKIYNNRRTMTVPGKVYKDAVKAQILLVIEDTYPMEWVDAIDMIYDAGGYATTSIGLHGPIANQSWKVGGSFTKSGNPRSPYQKKDATNYIKLFEDALSQATGIDDSVTMHASVQKIVDVGNPWISVDYRIYGPD